MARTGVNWVRLGAEGVAILTSILLAFAIDAWWDARQDRQEEVEVLRGLEDEFLSYQRQLDRFMEVSELSMRLLEGVLVSGPPTFRAPPPPAVADSALFLMSVIPTFDATGGALAALLSSGRLELLQSRSLRATLASWPNVISDIRDNELQRRDFDLDVVTPFLVSRDVPLARTKAVSGEWPAPLVSDAEAARSYAELFADPGFAAITAVAFAAVRNSANEYSSAADKVEEVIEAIRVELGRAAHDE